MSVQTFCRIDARIANASEEKIEMSSDIVANIDNTFFIEINTMPTIRPKNSFNFSFESILQSSAFSECIDYMKESIDDFDLNVFLLANSALSHVKSKC